WERRGPILDFGAEGEMDSAAATSPWVVRENGEWHMFYLGTPNGREVPAFPYLTLKAKSHSLSGPWKKQPEVIPFRTKPGTFYSQTASPGHITQSGEDYVQIFSSTNDPSPNLPFGQRTLGMARTRNLNGEWEVEQSPILPVSEQIENSSLYFEESIGVWFLLTNHIGIDEVEFTDAVWMYWSDDLHHWSPDNKAVVLDGKNCTWASRCIGMPSVIRVKDRLAVFYDAPGGDSIEPLHRDIGLAWLDLPLSIPSEATTPAKRDLA
ncbi:MAG: hypothetical protein KC917_19250, partial [Candidatus Omnitrophica bacterium]|nr:hypothetical protein [Candidatus Omnitrophota bacterium]